MKLKRRVAVAETMAVYWLAADVLGFSGSERPRVEHEAGGMDAEEAFEAIDSRGERAGSRDPGVVEKALWGKACLNLHVAMWREGLEDVGLEELRADPELGFVPEWAWRAVGKKEGSDP